MKAITTICLMILSYSLLTGCTSQSGNRNYRPATDDGIGYKEFAVSDTHYRVQFKARGNQRNNARDYALLRAAELTIAQGYDWFIVSKQTTRVLDEPDDFPESPEYIHSRRCGLLTCRSQTQRLPSSELDRHETYTLVLLNIHMGKGIRPEKNSYDAMETREMLSK